jgi:hypothetical protein
VEIQPKEYHCICLPLHTVLKNLLVLNHSTKKKRWSCTVHAFLADGGCFPWEDQHVFGEKKSSTEKAIKTSSA